MKMAGGSRDTTEVTLTDDDDDEESDSDEEPHRITLQALQQVPAQSVVVDDSSDVHVGPRLTYNGPVIVNQILQLTGEGRGLSDISQQGLLRQAITAPGNTADPLSNNTKENQFNNEVGTNPNAALRDHAGANLHWQTTTTPKKSVIVRLLWVFIVIISFTTVCLITAFAIQNSQYEELVSVGMKSSSHFNASVSVGFDPMMKTPSSEPFRLPGGHYIYSKQDLGAIKELCSEQLVHPTPVVVISHTTTRQCTNFDTCSEAARLIQLNIIGKRGSQNSANAADIGNNFLIGGDGNVYEGKGWDEMSSHRTPEGILGISFIGNYHKDRLTYGQIEAAQELLALGVKLEKLSPSYILVAHYQTASTDSPGKNIVKVIEKWPHWSPSYRIT